MLMIRTIGSSADTDERIAESIIRGEINFEREPWPKVSQTAKDLVKKMLDPNPSTRLTAKQVFGKDIPTKHNVHS
jgi:serine/threonine protein kinase